MGGGKRENVLAALHGVALKYMHECADREAVAREETGHAEPGRQQDAQMEPTK